MLKKYNLDPEVFSNYRPVANILYLSKTIETAVAEQLIDHMVLNTLHINHQSAYKSNHSCETLLLSLNNDILKAFDSNKCVILLLLDLSAAFDTVDHDRLMYILFHEIGLRGTALNWFKSYLLNRRQAVGINGKISNFVTETIPSIYNCTVTVFITQKLYLIYMQNCNAGQKGPRVTFR